MTNLQEAKLAREAEICYATLAMVTDYDCWHEEEEAVSGEGVMEVLRRNVALAQEVVRRAVAAIAASRSCDCGHALRMSLITEPTMIPPATLTALAPLVERYLDRSGGSLAWKRE